MCGFTSLLPGLERRPFQVRSLRSNGANPTQASPPSPPLPRVAMSVASRSQRTGEDGGSGGGGRLMMVRPRGPRRDKRRHVVASSSSSHNNATSLDLRNPYQVIAVAVRFDESLNDEDALRVPLETGGIYNRRLFARAVAHLEERRPSASATQRPFFAAAGTTSGREQPPWGVVGAATADGEAEFPSATATTTPSSPARSGDQGRRGVIAATTTFALTPIILSGLLANLESTDEGQHDGPPSHPPSATATGGAAAAAASSLSPTSTDLVAYCTQMRRAALARVRLRRERQRVQRVVTPVLLVGTLAVLYLYTASNFQRALVEYGFVDSCEQADLRRTGYGPACRMAEAHAWEHLNRPLQFAVGDGACTVHSCPMADGPDDDYHAGAGVPRYAIHTRLGSSSVPLEDVQGRGRRRRKKRTTQRGVHSGGRLPGDSSALPVQWLGDTTVNRLVRDVLVESQQRTTSSGRGGHGGEGFKLLDVGSGLSGTLFSLMRTDVPPQGWSYHGISLSRPEVHRARQLVEIHQVAAVAEVAEVAIEQGSFDDPLPLGVYDFAVALESLAYSRNLTRTLLNLAGSLKPDGVLVVVDDVVSPWAGDDDGVQRMADMTAKASLVTHEAWLSSFRSAGLQLHRPPRDLTLEFDLLDEAGTAPAAPSFPSWSDLAYGMSQKWSPHRSNESSVSVRAVHLVQDLVQNARGRSMRQAAFRRSDLALYMYVVVRKP